MLSSAVNPDVYLHLQGLSNLKREARKDPRQALDTVARQFEALFVQMMLKSMRSASPGDPLLGSQAGGFYRDMFDQQLSVELGRTGSLGIADQLVRQLRGLAGGTPAPVRAGLDPRSAAAPSAAASDSGAGVTVGRDVHALRAREAMAKEETPVLGSPAIFVDTLMPHARAAASRLGVSPEILLAQAALETGWGRFVIHRENGLSSHNLFGIKADGRWSGERAVVSTLEYENGVAVRRQAPFRAYDSYADSFADYVSFLQANPRYESTLQAAGDPIAFVRGLQEAGYATDPDYASKVVRIWRQSFMGGATASAPLANNGAS